MSSTCQIHAQQPEHAQSMHAVQQYVRRAGYNGQRGEEWERIDVVTPLETSCTSVTHHLHACLTSADGDLDTRELSMAVGTEDSAARWDHNQCLCPLRLLRQGRPGSLKLAFAIYPVGANTSFGVRLGCPRIPGQACDRPAPDESGMQRLSGFHRSPWPQ